MTSLLGPPSMSTGSPGMRFAVDGWDPSYGASLETDDELGQSSARVVTGVEVPEERWRPISADPSLTRPSTILFIDGVRRIEAQIWIDDLSPAGGPASEASPALCASYAAGTICCCAEGAHLLTAIPRRGLFTVAEHAVDVRPAPVPTA